MTQLVLNISDPSILPTLKKVVKAFDGVSIARPSNSATKKKKAKCGLDEALEDVRAGRVHTAKSTDDLFSTILGI
ncbi:MAG: hypothetical protein K2G00_00615 [Duncaniella sp.]|nr:hypothetical protein [Bacteroides sp.]MDE6061248.1 hypothetical protein [Duncaniella sp.]